MSALPVEAVHMLNGGSAPPPLRPEWLFELVNRVQALAAPLQGPPAIEQALSGLLPPESDFEHELAHVLVQRALTQRATIRSAVTLPARQTLTVTGTPIRPVPPRVDRAVAGAKALLQREYARHWTLNALARRVGTNRQDLELGFRALLSCTVHWYLTLRRIQAAKRLLATRAWRVDEIGKSVGDRSKAAFYFSFKRVAGVTPEQYRRGWIFVPATPGVLELLNPK